MATINMQIKIYTLPYLLTNAKSHSQVLYVMVDSAMTTQLSGIHRTTLGHYTNLKLWPPQCNRRDLILKYTACIYRNFENILTEISYSNPIYNVHEYPA